jgi:phosphate-selective porin OprO/OprP
LLFYDEPSDGRYLWEVGIAGSVRKPDEDIVRLRARGNVRSGPPGVLNPIYADTGNMHADQQEILALESGMQWGPWSMEAEYVGTWVENAVVPFDPPADRVEHGTPFFQGGYISLLYFLTGEHRSYNRQLAVFDRVIPNENFFWVDSEGGRCYGWGAWQIGARYSALDLNDNGINGGVLQSGTLGINWFMNPNARVQFNYDLTHRSQVRETDPGFINSYGLRFSYDF